MLELATRLERIDQQIHEATILIDSEPYASEETKDVVHEFCEKSESLIKELNKSESDEEKLLSGVIDLEELADEAKEAAQDDLQQNSIKNESFQKVLNAHNSLSQLKAEITGKST